MAHTVGAITLRVTAGTDRIVDVVPLAENGPCGALNRMPSTISARIVDPCGFRVAVARAWADHSAGREIGLIGLEHADDLSITWSVAAPGRHIGFGSVRAPCAGRMVWAFASVLDPDEITDVMGDLEDRSDGTNALASDGLTARLVHDELLDATVVHIEADPPGSSTMRVLDEVLRRMVAAVGTAEVIARI
ncbi:MAG: hypothetical protein ABW328_09820 [Ilumatobacteraceae bacterium]